MSKEEFYSFNDHERAVYRATLKFLLESGCGANESVRGAHLVVLGERGCYVRPVKPSSTPRWHSYLKGLSERLAGHD